MSKNRKKSSETEAHPSRRAFVKSAMLGAGATAALGTTGVGVGAQETNGEGITIPPEFAAAKKASLPAVDFPMIGDEPALLRVIEERAAEVLSPGDLRERAVQVCRRLFEAQREPTLALAAKDLGLSARTLQRKLAATSVSFRQIRDAAARSVAEQLLRDPERTVEEIAERVGYTSRSAFERAFTRWTGVTPAQWRRDQG